MIQAIEFRNFKLLRDTTLPLGAFTLILGPNASGKSTALVGLKALGDPAVIGFPQSVSVRPEPAAEGLFLTITALWGAPFNGQVTRSVWSTAGHASTSHLSKTGAAFSLNDQTPPYRMLRNARVFALNAREIGQAVQLQPRMELSEGGYGLAGVLDRLRDERPERFDALNSELGRWLPEFDRVLFETPASGQRSFCVRARETQCAIPAAHLSDGTLLALCVLTLAYLPSPPSIIGIEEPDRGIHPRLLRDVRDALYRLSYPDRFGEDREPVQVIATTHSPYFLDLFRDSPDEVVLAQKDDDEVRFTRLVDLPHMDEILQDAHLGDAWYSGVLGGVPAE